MTKSGIGKFLLLWAALAVVWVPGAACGGDDDDDDSSGDDDSDDEEPTYENFAQDFFETYCLFCHSDPTQNDAPFPLTTYDQVAEHLDKIKTMVVVEEAMPPDFTPGDFPSAMERAKLGEWIDNGAPES